MPSPDAVATAAAEVTARVHARLIGDAGDHATPTRERIAMLVRDEAPLLGDGEVAALVDRLAAEATGLGALEEVLADPTVTEVMVNGGPVWVERRGSLQRLTPDLADEAIQRLIERVVGPLGLRIDRSSPVVDGRLGDGSRVCVVVPPVAVDGPCVTIRRFGTAHFSLRAFCADDVATSLVDAVEQRRNIVVAGATSAGKTTLLNSLGAVVPEGERLITIEDAAELRLPRDHVVRLEARPPNAEGAGAVSIRALLRASLRLRPDRIIVGEVRDEAALDMLQAMNTGHAGSLSTCHANSGIDALRRLETMALMGDVNLSLTAVREQIAAAVDLVVQVARVGNGARRIVEVVEPAEVAGDTWSVRVLATGEAVHSPPHRKPRR